MREHTPASGATVDYTPQLAAANHCTTCSSVCCTLLAELLISTSSTTAPRAIPLAEHSVSEASLASCWLERPPIGFCLSVCTVGPSQAEIEALSFNPRRLSSPHKGGGERISGVLQAFPRHGSPADGLV